MITDIRPTVKGNLAGLRNIASSLTVIQDSILLVGPDTTEIVQGVQCGRP